MLCCIACTVLCCNACTVLVCAVQFYAVLCCAVADDHVLCYAVLCCAVLCCAVTHDWALDSCLQDRFASEAFKQVPALHALLSLLRIP